jgi:RimJ/RimL family protein N-acetyltransferase
MYESNFNFISVAMKYKLDFIIRQSKPMKSILLRNITVSDLPILFEQQRHPESNTMAAVPARDREAFDGHWAKIMSNEDIILRTIEVDGKAAGHLVSFLIEGKRQVGYWLGKEYWGKGIATHALSEFLQIVKERPLFAHVAKHNIGSRRVLEKCGFIILSNDTYIKVGGKEVEEFVLKLV